MVILRLFSQQWLKFCIVTILLMARVLEFFAAATSMGSIWLLLEFVLMLLLKVLTFYFFVVAISTNIFPLKLLSLLQRIVSVVFYFFAYVDVASTVIILYFHRLR